MDLPKVLVVMPVYNAEKFVEKALLSVLNQTYPNCHCLAVDDGSTDCSFDLLQKKRSQRLTVLSQINSGPGAVMNFAMRYAQERDIPFIARMDADDISMPTRLERQVELISQNPSFAACSANAYYIDSETEEMIGTSTVPRYSSLIKWEMRHGLRGLIQGATLFRTDALLSIGGYRSVFHSAEETDLFLRLADQFEFVNSKEYLYKIRLRLNSLSTENVRENIQYHFYALDCAEKRVLGKKEATYEKFLNNMPKKKQLRVWRDEILLKFWRENFRNKKMSFLSLVSLLDPYRILARILRSL